MHEARIEGGLVQANPVSGRLSPARRSKSRGDTLDYYLIYAVGFAMFLTVAVLQRALPRRWRSFPCDRSVHRSAIADARIATSNMIPFAFLG